MDVIQMLQGIAFADGGRAGFKDGGFTPNDLYLLKRYKYDPKEVATHKDGGKSLIDSLKTVGFANGGRPGYGEGEDVKLSDMFKINMTGTKSGKNQIQGAPKVKIDLKLKKVIKNFF